MIQQMVHKGCEHGQTNRDYDHCKLIGTSCWGNKYVRVYAVIYRKNNILIQLDIKRDFW